MTNKYTQGTWTIEKENKNLIVFSGKVYIGSVSSSDVKKEEAEANAKLIAASPDILKALQDLINLPLSLPNKATNGLFARLHEAKEAAKAAIEKATK